ncbi:MAG: NfeD family protein [Nitrososphaerota archaeon]|nr:NfeD family protein [Nitrososphaerota archaeon]
MDDEKIGLFAFARWGAGGLLIVSVLTALAAAFLLEWVDYHFLPGLGLSLLFFLADGAIVLVKLSEELHPMRYVDEEVVGKRGIIIKRIEGEMEAGVVRVGTQSWSAKSPTPIEEGGAVVVLRREGPYVWVAPASEGRRDAS